MYKYLNKQEAIKIVDILERYYNDEEKRSTLLHFNNPLQLTVALILAAQSTDKRVNEIIPVLFNKYKNEKELALANLEDIEEIIKPVGFYRVKAKYIQSAARTLVKYFSEDFPHTMEDLTRLAGIGRKSANIILQECFGKIEGIAVDTHVTRISRLTGMSKGDSQEKIEKDLMDLLPQKYWSKVNHLMVYHGREICIARRPNCAICPINNICKQNKQEN